MLVTIDKLYFVNDHWMMATLLDIDQKTPISLDNLYNKIVAYIMKHRLIRVNSAGVYILGSNKHFMLGEETVCPVEIIKDIGAYGFKTVQTEEYTFEIPSTYAQMHIEDDYLQFEYSVEYLLHANFSDDFTSPLTDTFVDYFDMKGGGMIDDEEIGEERFDIEDIIFYMRRAIIHNELKNVLDTSTIIPDEKFASLFGVPVGIPLRYTDFYSMLSKILTKPEQQDSESLLQKPIA